MMLNDESVLNVLGGVELFDQWMDHFDPIMLLRRYFWCVILFPRPDP